MRYSIQCMNERETMYSVRYCCCWYSWYTIRCWVPFQNSHSIHFRFYVFCVFIKWQRCLFAQRLTTMWIEIEIFQVNWIPFQCNGFFSLSLYLSLSLSLYRIEFYTICIPVDSVLINSFAFSFHLFGNFSFSKKETMCIPYR